MGYNSSFTGSMTPSKPIPDWLAYRINSADISLRVNQGDLEYCEGERGDVIPSSYEMHAYDFAKELFMVNKLLAKEGIKLNGEIERSGEEYGDFELFTARGGKVYSCRGEVVYRKKQEITVDQVTRYAVRLYKTESRDGKTSRKPFGWLGRREFAVDDGDRWFVSAAEDISSAPVFETRKDAVHAARNGTGLHYRIVGREDTI